MEYLFLFFLVVVMATKHRKMSVCVSNICLRIVCVYIILLMGLRYRVGIDTLNYMNSYSLTPPLDHFFQNNFTETRFEPGYLLLCSLCRSITKEFWLLQLVHSIILNVCVFIFIKRHCKNPFLGLFVYVILTWLYFNTEVIRESLAIAVFLLNYDNLKKNRWISYYLLSLVSVSFQFSAAILWLFPLVRFLKINIMYIVVCTGFFIIMPWMEIITQSITILSVSNRLIEHVGSAETLNLNWRLANTIHSVLCPIVALLIYHRIHKEADEKQFVLLHVLFGVGAFSIPIIFSRLSNYTIMFVVVYIANLINELRVKKYLKTFVFFILLISQAQYYYSMFWGWFPYVSIFSPYKVSERENLWYDSF